jgi:hypothetical protein
MRFHAAIVAAFADPAAGPEPKFTRCSDRMPHRAAVIFEGVRLDQLAAGRSIASSAAITSWSGGS